MNEKNEIWEFKEVELTHISENAHTEKNNTYISEQFNNIEPDVIVFELGRSYDPIFNELNKLNPTEISTELIKSLRIKSNQIRGDFNIIIDSLEYLWKTKNKKVNIHAFDAPHELLNYCIHLGNDWNIYTLTWNYIRDKYMAEFINKNSEYLRNKKVILQCHNTHWDRVRMILTENYIKSYNYYFKDYASEINVEIYDRAKLNNLLKRNHEMLYKHWKVVGDLNSCA